ncbi:type III-B CRISPR module-associated protein Cmr3 [Clostridium scatologenes]|uniref:CRISPR-associated protein Cmr3 n=1 Tax=Clostridium scatologenes TaxID=1548 RepID=A0A0E3JYY1_CLOSL|nr:type III-B CRISPR module-associated protein Cmr3 [Clostridium scatologenes]AKA67808.1 CRISPR-associated protein Cmr3 [Clostridium scatologenes]
MRECYFKIKPSDTLFFRDGHPFLKRLNNYLESLNVPYPSVFYGAIFSALLRQGNFKDILNSIRNKDNEIETKLEKNFNITGVYLYDEIKNELYVKAPLDLFEDGNSKSFGLYKDGFLYSPTGANKFNRCDDKFISLSDLIKHYSSRNVNEITLYPSKYFFTNYSKIGIEIDRQKRTVKEEHLYRINMVEFSDKRFSYLLKCEIDLNEDEIKDDVIRLGGESKIASFTHTFKELSAIKELNEFYNNTIVYGDKIKLILTTPMIIEKSSQDKKDDFDNFINNNNIECVVTGKPEYIGGFDMARNHQKNIRKAIPAGSVLIMKNNKFRNVSINQILDDSCEKYINLKNIEDNFRGFGSIIIMPFRRGDD